MKERSVWRTQEEEEEQEEGVCGIEKEEECYLRMEPLSCEWSKKTARFSLVSCLLSIGLFSPFSFFFSILLSPDTFLSSFLPFFLPLQYDQNYYFKEVGQVSEVFLDDYITVQSLSMSLQDLFRSILALIFFFYLIVSCIIIRTGIDGWIKSRVNITSDAEKSVKL